MAREFKSRARQVCRRCHERKVKCDLQTRTNGPCANCRREGTHCRKHIGIRQTRASMRKGTFEAEAWSKVDKNTGAFRETDDHTVSQRDTGPTTSQLPSPYLSPGQESGEYVDSVTTRGGLTNENVLSFEPSLCPVAGIGKISFPADTDSVYQQAPEWTTPSKSLSKVLVELYTKQLFPIIPVMENRDLDDTKSPAIVKQALYLGGSMMRPSKNYPGNLKSKDFFFRIKTLLFFSDHVDALSNLKGLCILSCWSYQNPTAATLDTPLQWSGMATRLAIQLGLHREATYARLENQKSARRTWWFLFIADTVQSLCYSRHPMLRDHDFDVQLPELTDFEENDTGSLTFCHLARLSRVLGEIERFAHQAQPVAEEETSRLLQLLQFWFNNRPLELHLFDSELSRSPYSRVINELHIIAFSAVILIYLLPGPHRQRRDYCAAATAAALCIDQLYGEILHRSEVCRLIPIHSWFILFSVVPRYYCARTLALYGQSIPVPEEQSMLATAVLSEMTETYASAQWVKERVDKMIQGTGAGLDPSGPGGRAAPGTPRIDNGLAGGLAPWLSATERPFDFRGLFQIPDDYCQGLASLKRNFEMDSIRGDGDTGLGQDPGTTGDLGWNILWPEFSLDDLDVLPGLSFGVDAGGF